MPITRDGARLFAVFTGAYLIAWFSLLRSGISYTDDVVRSITGESYFLGAARPVTDLLVRTMFGGLPLVDASPLPQLLALGLLAFASVAFVQHYGIEKRRILFLPALAIGINPFVAENLGYKFDSGFMCLALVLALFPLYRHDRGARYTLVGTVLLLVSLATYQAAIGAFLVVTLHTLVTGLSTESRLGSSIKRLALDIVPLVLSLLLYKILIVTVLSEYLDQSEWARMHSRTLPMQELASGIWKNIGDYAVQFYQDWSRTLVGKLAVVILIIFVASRALEFARSLRNAERACASTMPATLALSRATLLILALVGFLLAPGGLQYFLAAPVYSPRTLYASGILFAFMMADIVIAMSVPLFRRAVLLFEAWFVTMLATITALFGNLLAQQAAWENIKYPLLVNDIASFVNASPQRRIQFYGYIGYAPLVNVAFGKYPYLQRVVRYYIGNIWSFPATLSIMGLSRTQIVHELDALPPQAIRESYRTPILSRDGYRVFETDKGYLLVVFDSV